MAEQTYLLENSAEGFWLELLKLSMASEGSITLSEAYALPVCIKRLYLKRLDEAHDEVQKRINKNTAKSSIDKRIIKDPQLG